MMQSTPKPRNASDKLRELKAMHSALLLERGEWDNEYENIARFFAPRKYRNTEMHRTNSGSEKREFMDDEGIFALRTMAAGMHSGLTNQARPWFRLTLPDPDAAKHRSVREWLDETERRMRFLYSKSNFYGWVHGAYKELGAFGSFLGFQHPDNERPGLVFTGMTTGEYVMEVDAIGTVDTAFRVMDMTARNIVREFGYENCSQAVQRASERPETSLVNRFKVVHAIMPREDRDPHSLNNKNKPWASYHYEQGATDKFLRESGYDMFPGVGVRWDVTGQDAYGRSPAMDVLDEARMLQSVRLTHFKATHMHADPPMAHPDGLRVDLFPGSRTPVKTAIGGEKSIYPIYTVAPDHNGTMILIQDARSKIGRGLYNDLFRMLYYMPPTQKTATEIASIHEESLLQLGPVMERLHSELFIPTIDRTFYIMAEYDMLPPWPEEIGGMPLQVEFVSMLAQAQKMVATTAVNQYMGFIANYAQVWPELADAPDIDDIADSYAEYLGLEAKNTTSREDREAKRQARAQAQQAREQAEAMNQAIGAAKTLGDTQMNGGESSALDELMSGAGGRRGAI